ncbi:unnamed protein product [Heligmosomoides polygyrus]|uniref:Choline O-acetyltransferase n=1 Tax=Heligmosomoides polygyrus TaxID=6339 RepID=A0A3P8B2G5_HELPZ|nr:unnamed protein product [Heligmosomoides polygyrus]
MKTVLFVDFQRPLPKAPVPSLDHSLDRYVEYAEVVAQGIHVPLQKTRSAVDEFRKSGDVYQKRLLRLAEQSNNWINQFWLPEMYLRIRLPLPVNTSPAYIFPQQNFKNDDEWLRYTALLIRGFVEYKNKIDTKQVEREVSTGKVKVNMCMQQYERILACYRQPGTGEDEHLLKPKRNHENEHAFVVHTRIGGDLLPFADILFQLQQVLRMSEARAGLVVAVGAAGVGDRERAAAFWDTMREVDVNCKSLTWAQEALFVVCLDDEDKKSVRNHVDLDAQEKDLVEQGKHILTGGGSRGYGLNRWYDATIQLVVSRSGTNGLCIEHSCAEGIVIINMAESALRFERENRKRNLCNSGAKGNCLGLLFYFYPPANLKAAVGPSLICVLLLTQELDLEVLLFNDFGREFIKKAGFSPDGFVQLALQLAHFMLHGYLVSTYESASLRRFRSGRVDNIRANTKEALEWVQAMTRDDSKNLMGEGIDNHLCALLVLARDSVENGEIKTLPAIFRDPLWTELMRFPLSTSQVTTSPDITNCYLCYGAVVRDGYGCAYNLQKDAIIFAPSAFKSNPRTDLVAFKDSIRSALHAMKNLVQ